jgi:hypothetical protein
MPFMPLYYMLIDAELFQRRIVPDLGMSWAGRNFGACRDFCRDLIPFVSKFSEQFHTGAQESLVSKVAGGLPFDKVLWSALLGEILLFSAQEIPEIQTDPDAMLLLETGRIEPAGSRELFSPIEQVHFGSQDLAFGSKVYRPFNAGLNDTDDVTRLLAYLNQVDTHGWRGNDLAPSTKMESEELEEELEFARQCFTALKDLYRSASERNAVVLCEKL